MNISEQIINVIDNLCQKFGIAIDWTAANVLPYVETLLGKFIKWEISTSIAWIIIMTVCTVIALIAAIIICKCCYWGGFEWFLFGCVLVILILVIGSQVFDIIECKTFPEKVIYDYITYQINN
jgi:hypothetical protein